MKCKGDCAASVSEITPLRLALARRLLPRNVDIVAFLWEFESSRALDKSPLSGFNRLTYLGQRLLGDPNVPIERPHALKGRCPARGGRTELLPRESPRSEVPGGGVLRSSRCRAGQVRDVASCPRGGCVGDRRSRGVRRLPADILPCLSSIYEIDIQRFFPNLPNQTNIWIDKFESLLLQPSFREILNVLREMETGRQKEVIRILVELLKLEHK